MEVDDDGCDRNSSSKKRHHPDSVTAPKVKSSLEILQLVEHPNFEELSRWNPAFARAWEATRQEQKETHKTFSACVSQAFTIALTRALLKTYLDIQLPYLETNHLCPPVPNRFFYLHWIHSQLLQRKSQLGMDIGAGATAIYSLLAAKFFECLMFTTEIDPVAADMAHQNIKANQLENRIHVTTVAPSHSQDAQQPPGGPLERALAGLEQYMVHHQGQIPTTIDFVMTNPPFYDPKSVELTNPRAGDGRARTAMTVSEGSYPGGEVGFVTEIFADSLRRRRSAKWFSSMLGKKTSLLHLQKMLTHVLGPAHIRVTEYEPGQYTRWFLAWTMEQPEATAPGALMLDHTFRVTLPPGTSDPVAEVISRVSSYCSSSPGGWALAVTPLRISTSGGILKIHEVLPVPPIQTFVDESDSTADQLHIPEIILQALHGADNTQLLPIEGHFVLQVSIQYSSRTADCQVQVAGYRHSSRGQAALKKIGSTLEGDICRTNRSWRRKLKGEQALRVE
jgi:23S rRNA A1618 N6-methylase RlmF